MRGGLNTCAQNKYRHRAADSFLADQLITGMVRRFTRSELGAAQLLVASLRSLPEGRAILSRPAFSFVEGETGCKSQQCPAIALVTRAAACRRRMDCAFADILGDVRLGERAQRLILEQLSAPKLPRSSLAMTAISRTKNPVCHSDEGFSCWTSAHARPSATRQSYTAARSQTTVDRHGLRILTGAVIDRSDRWCRRLIMRGSTFRAAASSLVAPRALPARSPRKRGGCFARLQSICAKGRPLMRRTSRNSPSGSARALAAPLARIAAACRHRMLGISVGATPSRAVHAGD